MTLPKCEKKVIRHKQIYLKTQKQRPDKKIGGHKKIMVNCDVICGSDENMVWCAPPRSSEFIFSVHLKQKYNSLDLHVII